MFFSPVGKITDVNINSSWSDPKFTGAYLPDDRDNTGDSFSAHWNVLHLNRNFPQQWINDDQNVENSDFGFELLLTVDNYKKSFRSIQYAILFIAFTFIVFFFVEIMQKVFIHPIQYILVGFALIVFFTLLLSISEQMNFNLAYLLSAAATLILVTGYVKAILKNTKIALMVAGILALLYSFIFVIIQLEDMALLIGSIGLFIVLSAVMYLSRKIDWYNLNQSAKETENNG
jgi:inner membrane protein